MTDPLYSANSAHRLTLLDSIFWEILPSKYAQITSRWAKIAGLYDDASADILAMDRAGAQNSLKPELDILEHDIDEYKDVVKNMDITDVAGIYVVAGRLPHRAFEIAKDDLMSLEGSLSQVEEKVKEIRADVRYGMMGGQQ